MFLTSWNNLFYKPIKLKFSFINKILYNLRHWLKSQGYGMIQGPTKNTRTDLLEKKNHRFHNKFFTNFL